MDTQELEAGDTLDLRPVDEDGGVCATLLPEVHNELFGLLGVESQVVVSAPLCQMLNLFSVCRLIVVADEADHRCVVCELDNGIRTMYRRAVVGEEGVEERTLLTNRLGSVG